MYNEIDSDSSKAFVSALAGSTLTPRLSFIGSSLINPLSSQDGAPSVVGASPMFQSLPGGYAYSPNTPASYYNNVAVGQPGWAGGDPDTNKGINKPDPGNYGHIDNGTTEAQSISAAASDPTPKQSWVPGVNSELNSARSTGIKSYLQQAVQTAYNNTSWMLNNISFPSASSTDFGSGYVQIVGDTTQQAAECVAGLAGAYVFGTTAGTAGLASAAGVINGAGAMAATVAAVNGCANLIVDGYQAVMGTIQDILQGGENSLRQMGNDVGDFQTPGQGIGASVKGKIDTLTSPGYTPSAAMLNEFKSVMTPAAKALYFPHG